MPLVGKNVSAIFSNVVCWVSSISTADRNTHIIIS